MGMGIDQWEWEGMGILIVFPHTSSLYLTSIPRSVTYGEVHSRRKYPIFLECCNDLYKPMTQTNHQSRITQQRCFYYNRNQLIRYSYSDNITIHCVAIT